MVFVSKQSDSQSYNFNVFANFLLVIMVGGIVSLGGRVRGSSFAEGVSNASGQSGPCVEGRCQRHLAGTTLTRFSPVVLFILHRHHFWKQKKVKAKIKKLFHMLLNDLGNCLQH